MALAPGTRLGAYEIISPLGAGGMGEVYKGRDTRLDRVVAIKVVTGTRAADPESRQRFEHEARTIAALNHPHICIIHDVGRHPATSPGQAEIDFLVMEFLEGETLADRLRRGALKLEEALAIAIQIGDAMTAAHRVGIVHRDLKPGNVMLTKSGSAKLLDFGLAAQAPPGPPPGLQASLLATAAPSLATTRPPSASSASTGFSGTVQYMAPEQVDGQPPDVRSDVFAFGCVLYEMLAGRKAFEGASAMSVIAAIMNTEPKPVEALASAPPVLDHLLRRCLEKDPERRWQSIADVTGELRWIAGQPLAAPMAAAAPSKDKLTARQWVAVAFAAAIVFGLVLPIALVRGLRASRGGGAESGTALQFEVVTPPTDAGGMALSDDGRLMAFVANEERRPVLWLRSLDRVETRKLPGTEGARAPFFSPDGRSIGYFADGRLKRVDVATGASLDIASAPNGRGGDWGRDGTILYSPDVQSPIMRVASGGGTPVAVTKPEGRTAHRSPQFLDDQRFIFFVGLGTPEVNGLYLGSLAGGTPARRFATTAPSRVAFPDRLLTMQQGSLVAYTFSLDDAAVSGEPVIVARGLGDDGTGAGGAFAVSRSGVLAHRAGGTQRRQLIWVDRRGTLLASIGEPGTDAFGAPELSPDERAVALFLSARGNNEVGVIDLARNLPRLVTNGPPADAHPLWDPDGRHVVYVSGRLNGNGPVRQAIDGDAPPEKLLPDAVEGMALSWTRDRRYVLLRQGGAQPDLAAVTLDGKTTIPIAKSPYDEFEGQFSPDGAWVAFVSNESSRSEVYVQKFPEGTGRVQVSTGGGTQVRWSADGRELFYIARDGKMMAVPLAPSPAGITLGTAVALFQTYLATGGNVIGNKAQYAVARDGRFLLNAAIETPSAPIVVTTNWARLLQR